MTDDNEAPRFQRSAPTGGIAAETWRKVCTLEPAPISDILHARGLHRQVLRNDIRPLELGSGVVGLARTMASRPLIGEPQPGHEYELLFSAIDGLAPGEVLVTDEMDCCVWGELCAEASIRRGGNGAVIDGFARDAAMVRRLGFPTFCRGRHMSDMLYHRAITAINEPVLCGGVAVRPGDLILGGEDGVVVVPAALIEEVVAEAYTKSQEESKVRKALREGMSAGEAYKRFGVM
jgi:regulator of RNase E activity RraA